MYYNEILEKKTLEILNENVAPLSSFVKILTTSPIHNQSATPYQFALKFYAADSLFPLDA